MRKQVLMIVDCNEEFRISLDRELRAHYTIHQCSDGQEALEAAAEIMPDVMIVDLMLTTLDGISLLHELRSRHILPMVLATTRLLNDYVAESAVELGIGYLMLKPCNLTAVVSRVMDLSRHLNPVAGNLLDPREAVVRQMRRMGISSLHNGWDYLAEAVLIRANDPTAPITKEIYPAIADKFHCTEAQVERSIRSAIKSAWMQNRETWTALFGAGTEPAAERPPSNGAVIIKFTAYLRAKLSVNPEESESGKP